MTKPVAYGIDFGTTNSSISIAYGDSVEMLDVYPTDPVPPAMPSVAYLHRNGNRSAGSEARELFTLTGSQRTSCDGCSLVMPDLGGGSYSECRQFTPGGGCLDSRLISELKNELANSSFRHTHSWATDFDLTDLVAVVISDLKRRADAHSGADVRRAVVGYPVAFVGTTGRRHEELQNRAEERLVEAAQRAGFEDVELFPEPAAAVLNEVLPDGVAVSVDFGGGTFDVAVVELNQGEGEVIALQGAGIGGSLFDRLIFREKVAPELGLDRTVGDKELPIPGWFRESLSSIGGLRRILTSKQAPFVVADIRRTNPRAAEALDSILYGGQAHRFYSSIEQAKIALSDAPQAHIDFHAPGVNLSVRLDENELEEIVQPHLEVIRTHISHALDSAGVRAGDVTTVIRTGGSSQLSAFVAMLSEMFGEERVVARDAFASVAFGLGLMAQEGWA